MSDDDDDWLAAVNELLRSWTELPDGVTALRPMPPMQIRVEEDPLPADFAERHHVTSGPRREGSAASEPRESLVEWLSARLDEDERDALCATFCDPEDSASGDFTEWHVDAPNPKWPVAVNVANGTAIVAAGYNGAYEHIARWDPARVLAEVAAKRDILDVHHNMNDGDCAVCVRGEWGYPTNGGSIPAPWPCMTIKLLALPYAGRDGWREEWRPE